MIIIFCICAGLIFPILCYYIYYAYDYKELYDKEHSIRLLKEDENSELHELLDSYSEEIANLKKQLESKDITIKHKNIVTYKEPIWIRSEYTLDYEETKEIRDTFRGDTFDIPEHISYKIKFGLAECVTNEIMNNPDFIQIDMIETDPLHTKLYTKVGIIMSITPP